MDDKKALPDLPSLSTRRQWWYETQRRTLIWKALVLCILPFISYWLAAWASEAFTFIPVGIALYYAVACFIVPASLVVVTTLRTYPMPWEVEIDQKIRRRMGQNDAVEGENKSNADA